MPGLMTSNCPCTHQMERPESISSNFSTSSPTATPNSTQRHTNFTPTPGLKNYSPTLIPSHKSTISTPPHHPNSSTPISTPTPNLSNYTPTLTPTRNLGSRNSSISHLDSYRDNLNFSDLELVCEEVSMETIFMYFMIIW